MLPLSHFFSLVPLEFFARAGGGGSGGSSGGGEGIFFILGYLPMHFVGAGLARFTKKNPDSTSAKLTVNAIGWPIAIVYAIFWMFVWHGLGFLVGLAALAGMGAGLYGWFGKIKQSPLVKNALSQAAANDSAWDEEKLTAFAQSTFVKYQQDWSNFDSDSMKSYLTDNYVMHAWLLMTNLHQMDRRNIIEDITIAEAEIVNLNDSDNDDEDTFTVGFSVSATDTLTETSSDTILFTDKRSFTEYWTFLRDGKSWRLDNITQATTDVYKLSENMRQLAQQRGYYYSPDMGWLFIPKHGQLFDGAKFGTSDINNHIIGMYNNQLLVQVYSYSKDPQNHSKPYVVAQAALPKSYGQIVVRRKKGLQLFSHIKGLEKVETEWTQFNDKYEVYATDYELATSFELLNPTYMEQLEAVGFEVNIEVVDNVVYLYAAESNMNNAVGTYDKMLDLLDKAFKEMRL